MTRTACYGTCPQYKITIYHHGLVRYEGKMFVDKIGCFEAMLSDRLIHEIKSIENSYLGRFIDYTKQGVVAVLCIRDSLWNPLFDQLITFWENVKTNPKQPALYKGR